MKTPRPIFVGDVQGCADEFDELLERAEAAFGDDFELWVVGDLINRGPENLRLLGRVRALVEAGRARYVLGNHEVGLLSTAAGIRPLGAFDTFDDVLSARDADRWIEWLRCLPLVETGRLGQQRFAMTHAAVHPDWSLEELERNAARVAQRLGGGELEDAWRLLSADPQEDPDRDVLGRLTGCRTVSRSGKRWSPELPRKGWEPWHEAWSRREHDYAVVYGHWALQGLHVAPRLRGLDTGCVHHGRGRDGFLTAWLPEPTQQTPFDLPDRHFWQVRARRAYYARRDEGENDTDASSASPTANKGFPRGSK